MKKLILIFTGLIAIACINAQSLEEIVKKYSTANKQEQLAKLKTIRITGNMSMAGMEIPVVMHMKKPDKIKTITSVAGQEIINVYDGVKGYQINPMTGSSKPEEMTPSQVKQTLNSNLFQNYLLNYFKKGQLKLTGVEDVKGKPAFRIKATSEDGTVLDLFIDKSTYYLTKILTNISQGGTPMTVESFPSDYTETHGIVLPMKTTSSAQGIEFTINFTKVEVDVPMDDSIFRLK